VISTAPAEPAGAVAVIEVSLSTVKLVAAVDPNATALALVKCAPVIVTDVPPEIGPLLGETLDTVGASTNV
jgi:hypothetical protein